MILIGFSMNNKMFTPSNNKTNTSMSYLTTLCSPSIKYCTFILVLYQDLGFWNSNDRLHLQTMQTNLFSIFISTM